MFQISGVRVDFRAFGNNREQGNNIKRSSGARCIPLHSRFLGYGRCYIVGTRNHLL